MIQVGTCNFSLKEERVMNVEEKLASLGLVLPPAPAPVAAYVPAVRAGTLLFTSGQLPFRGGELAWRGKVGANLTWEQGYEAARACLLNCLSVIKAEIGDLERVERVVRVAGFVNSAPGFHDQPKVINGASELLLEIFGPRGRHSRVAVGAAELPLNAAVELEMIVLVKD